METNEQQPAVTPVPPIPQEWKMRLAKDYTIPQIMDVLRDCDGYVSIAAPKLGVSERSLRARIRRSSNLRKLVIELEKHWKDIAERTFIKTAVKAQHLSGMMYYLRTKGKEIDNPSGDAAEQDGDVSEILEMIADIRRPERPLEHHEIEEETSLQSPPPNATRSSPPLQEG